MKNLFLILSLSLFCHLSYAQNAVKSFFKDEKGKEYQMTTLLSLNKNTQHQQLALIIVTQKDNIIHKLGFAPIEGEISCLNYCQYYVQFDNTAAKYTFSSENKSIKLENSQNSDFIYNIQHSKELTLILNKQRYYFDVQNYHWTYTPENVGK